MWFGWTALIIALLPYLAISFIFAACEGLRKSAQQARKHNMALIFLLHLMPYGVGDFYVSYKQAHKKPFKESCDCV